MFHVAPLGVAAVIATIAIFSSCIVSGYVYEEPSATTARPYDDLGFNALPDWSAAIHWLPQTYAVLHGCAFIVFMMFHQHRITVLRRTLLIVSASIALQGTQTLCTTLPSPNPTATFFRRGAWSYDLYVIQYTLANLMVRVFISRTLWSVVWTAAGGIGCLLLIAAHRYYTVDIICDIVPPVLVFLLYHWYARSEAAIMKRHVMYWLERDVFKVDCTPSSPTGDHGAASPPLSPVVTSPRADATIETPKKPREEESSVDKTLPPPRLSPSKSRKQLSPLDAPPTWPLFESLLAWTIDEYVWIPQTWDVFRLEREGIYSIYPADCLFAVTDGRGPSSATQGARDTIRQRSFRLSSERRHYDTASSSGGSFADEVVVAARAIETIDHDPAIVAVAELVDRARRLDPTTRRYLPIAVAVGCIVCGGSVGLLNLVPIHFADERRPLHIPLPPDVIHDTVNALPDRTADFFIYPIAVCTIIFTVASSFTWTIFTRISVMYAMSMSLRMITMTVTALPDPSPVCAERYHPDGTTCGDL
ncbi:membrane-associated protein, putative, partial [Bodo saltans]